MSQQKTKWRDTIDIRGVECTLGGTLQRNLNQLAPTATFDFSTAIYPDNLNVKMDEITENEMVNAVKALKITKPQKMIRPQQYS